ncbi:MAG: MarR family transcriptional regulator [Geobacteraceae bacterium]|nr:MarR family transcriptional regulator [Geobacteraceae bacterium]NTW79113.1 MarR family transcriptional regulator [Geobacteraceae bacterium]
MNFIHTELREELIDELLDRLNSLSNATEGLSREVEKLTGLSRNHVLTIKAVSRSPSARVSELARSMYLNPATMVRILDHLEEQGLITRTRSKEDRRVVEIKLTEKAAGVKMVLHDITHGCMKHCLGITDNQELLDILKVLRRLSSLFDMTCLHPLNKTMV